MKIKLILYIFIFAFSIYFIFSVFFPYSRFVGIFGEFLGKSVFLLFGYLSPLIALFFIFLSNLWYKNKFNKDISRLILYTIFLFINLMFLQALIFKEGLLGILFISSLQNIIGIVGSVIFVLLMLFFNFFLFFEKFLLNKKQHQVEDILNIDENKHKNDIAKE